jgi:hypothetical protein
LPHAVIFQLTSPARLTSFLFTCLFSLTNPSRHICTPVGFLHTTNSSTSTRDNTTQDGCKCAGLLGCPTMTLARGIEGLT